MWGITNYTEEASNQSVVSEETEIEIQERKAKVTES